mmetsp:Transcript_44428/g.129185  ORF Transcript_44428/g.129185 Transcript_44428/m.129185 type:complete len:248 (-) Transcript_44428:646-1389(-)
MDGVANAAFDNVGKLGVGAGGGTAGGGRTDEGAAPGGTIVSGLDISLPERPAVEGLLEVTSGVFPKDGDSVSMLPMADEAAVLLADAPANAPPVLQESTSSSSTPVPGKRGISGVTAPGADSKDNASSVREGRGESNAPGAASKASTSVEAARSSMAPTTSVEHGAASEGDCNGVWKRSGSPCPWAPTEAKAISSGERRGVDKSALLAVALDGGTEVGRCGGIPCVAASMAAACAAAAAAWVLRVGG